MDYLRLGSEIIRDQKVKVFAFWLGPYAAIIVAHPEPLKQVINKHVEKPSWGPGYNLLKPWLGDGLIISKGHKWTRNRKLLTPAFHFNILKGYVDVINDTSKTFLVYSTLALCLLGKISANAFTDCFYHF